ncbi:MAG: acyl-ACP--UDP-N-acetylglucosamine O-acyltransferase [Candidatus Cloacimonetes bacterium]|nr:acyl-ACP--UDP-N-acetylglucosamine O-acyltransferase [Candidatus Cloacimonadota bacterium]
MTDIHPSSIIKPGAEIGEDCHIGPYCIIGSDVRMGNHNILHSAVVLDGRTTIGSDNKFFHAAVIGSASQDLKDKGDPTELIIGDNNTFREFCTVNKSANMDHPTIIGDDCLLMAYSHVAHDCRLGNRVILANAVNLAGHCELQNNVTVGGMSAMSQFVRIGQYVFIGGMSGINKDIPPYVRGVGLPFKVVGINSVGLERAGFSEESRHSIKEIYRIFYRSELNVSQAMEKTQELKPFTPEQEIFLEFIKGSQRGLLT